MSNFARIMVLLLFAVVMFWLTAYFLGARDGFSGGATFPGTKFSAIIGAYNDRM